mmetsp:Transcript_6259/g.28686  ORF Transcript_6259/g.28686 Transcript_6259/m.28686 type:complete len:381 (-) Transcript_6259:332-1474(-)
MSCLMTRATPRRSPVTPTFARYFRPRRDEPSATRDLRDTYTSPVLNALPPSCQGTLAYTSSVDISAHDPASAIIVSPSHHTCAYGTRGTRALPKRLAQTRARRHQSAHDRSGRDLRPVQRRARALEPRGEQARAPRLDLLARFHPDVDGRLRLPTTRFVVGQSRRPRLLLAVRHRSRAGVRRVRVRLGVPRTLPPVHRSGAEIRTCTDGLEKASLGDEVAPELKTTRAKRNLDPRRHPQRRRSPRVASPLARRPSARALVALRVAARRELHRRGVGTKRHREAVEDRLADGEGKRRARLARAEGYDPLLSRPTPRAQLGGESPTGGRGRGFAPASRTRAAPPWRSRRRATRARSRVNGACSGRTPRASIACPRAGASGRR